MQKKMTHGLQSSLPLSCANYPRKIMTFFFLIPKNDEKTGTFLRNLSFLM